MDERIVLEIDHRVAEQQITLEKAGVAGFFRTIKPEEVRLQMYVLDIIRKLSKTPFNQIPTGYT